MFPKLKISSFLPKRFEKIKQQCSGCLFGVFYGDKTLLLIGFNVESTIGQLNYKHIQHKFPAELDLCGLIKFGDCTDGEAHLNEILKDVDITDNPIVLNCPLGTLVGMKASIFMHGKLQEIPFEIIDETELYREFCFTRLRCNFSFYTEETIDSIKKNMQKLRKNLASGSLAFRISNTKVYLTSNENGSNQTMPNETRVLEILKLKSLDDSDKNNQVEIKNIKSKANINKKDNKIEPINPNHFEIINIDVLKNKTKETDKQPAGSAVSIIINKNEEKLLIPLEIDAMAILYRNTKLLGLYDILIESICRSLRLVENTFVQHLSEAAQKHSTSKDYDSLSTKQMHLTKPEIFHFQPSEFGHFITVVYLNGVSEHDMQMKRKKLHHHFGLSLIRPYFRRANQYLFKIPKSPLINTHIDLKPSGIKNGRQHLVQGKYSYYHYMQQNFNDNGWGCAYRSLQTLCSWFKLQGYTNCEPPTHDEIQRYLVKIGDKDRNFINSHQWIGSTEVSMCLQGFLGVESRIMHCNSGGDLKYKGSDLAVHFETKGTPIMIGGGQLAHTIIGVDYNEDGDIKFLILDPHYTDSDDIQTIQAKGWCGWKSMEFWDKRTFYNLCLPQRPIIY